MALKNPWNVPLHARHLGVTGIPSCNLLFNGPMLNQRGHGARLSRG